MENSHVLCWAYDFLSPYVFVSFAWEGLKKKGCYERSLKEVYNVCEGHCGGVNFITMGKSWKKRAYDFLYIAVYMFDKMYFSIGIIKYYY